MNKLIIAISLMVGFSIGAADAVKGRALYSRCITCHGKDAYGKESQKAPRIAGQHEWYIHSALTKFKNKERSNPAMLPFIKKLSDQDFLDLAAYISGLK